VHQRALRLPARAAARPSMGSAGQRSATLTRPPDRVVSSAVLTA
jgi:hypothetical protein